MNPAHDQPSSLPRYGVGDDDKTRPGVVLVDWNDDDEPTVYASPLELAAVAPSPPPSEDLDDIEELVDIELLDDVDELDDGYMDAFRPRFHGVGRRPGAVALAVVLGASLTIGVFAVLGSGEAQAEASAATAPVLP
jgi:hypothetical protein